MFISQDPRLAGRVAFTHPNFVRYTLARFFVVLALEMQSVAVAWQVYEITRRPLDLGYVGLAQFAPGFILFLFAGHAADRFDRRRVLTWCYAGYGVCSALLLTISWRAPQSVHLIYAVLVLVGVCRSFAFPVSRAILPQLVPEEHFSNAVAWNSSIFQVANIAGPAIGGIAYALFHGPHAVYAIAVIVSIVSTVFTLRIHPQTRIARKRARKRISEIIRKRTNIPAHRPGRFPFHRREKSNPRLDLARHVCRPLRRSRSLAPRLCQNHPPHRPLGSRPPAQRSRSGSPP